MKTQIIQLEGHDDVISTRDKMGWGQTSRILLVWPVKGRVLGRQLDLLLLQRHSAALGAQLALVTRDQSVSYFAQQLGIPTFPNVRSAGERPSMRTATERSAAPGESEDQTSPPRSAKQRRRKAPRRARGRGLRGRYPRLRKPLTLNALLEQRDTAHPQPVTWNRLPVVQRSAFAAGVLAFLALLFMLAPGAKITLQPRQKIQTITLPVLISPQIETPRLTGEIPAKWVTIVVEGRDSLPTSGSVMVPEKAASGGVTFTNLTDQVVEIPAGLVVRTGGTDAVRYATTRDGEVPAGPGEHITLPVEALLPGSQGNVAARRIQIIEGELGLRLTAANPAALRNGSDLAAAGPNSTDQQKLYGQMLKSLETTAEQELEERSADETGAREFAVLPSLQFSQALEKRFQPDIDAPSEMLELTLRAEFKVMVIASSDLVQIATPLLEASRPEGFSTLPGSLHLEAIQDPVMKGAEHAAWNFLATSTLQANIAPEMVIQAALGQPVQHAAETLYQQLPLEKLPEIRLFPDWWPYMPLVPLRMEVNQAYGG